MPGRAPCSPQGLVEETRELLARYGHAPALASLGYRQAAQYLDGNLTLEQAIAAASQGHRNYAKRQLTWFRREPEVSWLKRLRRRSFCLRRGGAPGRPGKIVTRCAIPGYNES